MVFPSAPVEPAGSRGAEAGFAFLFAGFWPLALVLVDAERASFVAAGDAPALVFVDEPVAGFAEERAEPEVRPDFEEGFEDAFDDLLLPDRAGDFEDFVEPEEGSDPKPSICFQEDPPSFIP